MPENAAGTDRLLERLRAEVPSGDDRVVTSIAVEFEDGTAVAVLAARRPGGAGHDSDERAALIASPGADPAPVADVLLSTEYGPDGMVRRVGLELYEEPESVPMRIAGDREGEPEVSGDGRRRIVSRMTFRLDGARGAGVHEVVGSE